MKLQNPLRLLFLFLAVSTFSCSKKSDSSGDSYVKFKLNGEWVTYDGLGELGPDLGNATLTDLGVTGTSKDRKNTFDISIQINGSDFKTGLYASDQYPDYQLLVDYLVNPDPNTMKYYEIDDALGLAPSKYTVHISSITPTQIKGTFTGNYLYDNFSSGDPDGGIAYITEGQFQVKRIR